MPRVLGPKFPWSFEIGVFGESPDELVSPGTIDKEIHSISSSQFSLFKSPSILMNFINSLFVPFPLLDIPFMKFYLIKNESKNLLFREVHRTTSEKRPKNRVPNRKRDYTE